MRSRFGVQNAFTKARERGIGVYENAAFFWRGRALIDRLDATLFVQVCSLLMRRSPKRTKEIQMAKHDNTQNPAVDKRSHPVAKGTGAVVGGAAGGIAGGAAAGAAAGGMTGPVGAAVGAVAGAVVGALAGKKIADAVDPAAEDQYWRDNYSSREYATGATYDDYGPAYRYGVDAFTRYPDRSFDDVEADLDRGWRDNRGSSSLEWDRAKHATRDAWRRLSDAIERATPGDSDRDGK